MDDRIVLYETARGESPVDDFLSALQEKARTKCVSYMLKLVDPGPPLPTIYAEKIRGDIWELKPEWGNVEYRILYASLPDGRYVMLHAVKKKRRMLPAREFTTAEARLADSLERCAK